MKYYYYYKRKSGAWVFPDVVITNDRDAIQILIEKRKAGYTTWRLYLDLAEDFEKIKSLFFTPEYWENKTWEQEEAL